MRFTFRGRTALRIAFLIVIATVALWAPAAFALVCGDSSPDPGEECDDGNTSSGDGCSATCTVEAGFDCTAAIAGQNTENFIGDGSFELDDGSWLISGWTAGRCDDSCSGGSNLASDGEFWIWVGGTGDTANSGNAVQTFTIPSSATSLTFDVQSAASGCGDSSLSVDIDGNVLWTYEDQGNGECKTVAPFGYETVVVDISLFSDNSPHTVTLTGDYVPAGGGQNANWFFDNFHVDVPLVSPIPPTPSVCTAIVCGDGILGSTETCDDGNASAGDGCSATCQVEQPNFVCEDPLPAAPSGEDIVDGGLEAGSPNPAWQETGTVFTPICSEAFCGAALANDGAFFAWFGGSNDPNQQTLAQNLVISSTATDLTFELLVGVCDSADDSLTVEIDGIEIYRNDCIATLPTYQLQTIPLGAFADGAVHSLQFIGNTVATNAGNSNFFVDDISIQDNVAFPGVPGSCFELATACDTPEQFEGAFFPPTGWTTINLSADAADGWGASDDGICASANWSPGTAGNNATGGGGLAACADSDATGQADIDGGGTAQAMDSYLCSPAMDLTQVTDPQFSFLVNYQTSDNSLGDEDSLQVLVGTIPPNAISVGTYTSLGEVFDHLDSTLELSESLALNASLAAQNAESSAHVCFRYRGTYAWYAQIDNAALRGSVCAPPPLDSDGDGVPDSADNCTLAFNQSQLDTDGDGHGNACDADLDNNCTVNFLDFSQLKTVFFGSDADADFNGDGVVNFIDLGIMKMQFFTPPGPSAAGLCS